VPWQEGRAAPDGYYPRIAGKPVYLILAMGADRIVRIKAQNLIANLPLREAS
jgi:hypothetical protein